MAGLTWFRAYSRMVDDDKLRLLAFEDRWHFVALLCCKAQGLLDHRDQLMQRRVAVKLGLDTRELEEVTRRLAEVGLIDAETLTPLAWDSLQFRSDHDPTRNERQQRFREAKRTGNALRNEPVTRTETETEAETETDNLAPTVLRRFAEPKRPAAPAVPVAKIVDAYHELLPMCPRVKKLTAAREAQIRARWRSGDLPDVETWREYFAFVAESRFLTGRITPPPGRKLFVADLEWLAREGNYAKVYEGKYHEQVQAR